MLLNQALGLPFHQREVDFVIPNLEEDLHLYIDPFLFFKSNNPEYQAVHSVLHKFFSIAILKVREGQPEIAHRMMRFPEVKEIMLGLSSGSHSGKGMGGIKGEIIYNEIVSNKDIIENGIRHLAEMQLLIEGVGFDMVSDMTTNIVKPFFVEYTKRQCFMHNIPIENGVCLEHIFDWDELEWDDEHVNLPVNPKNGKPILFVPKTVVRRFADIDYKDFWTSTYRYMLRDAEVTKSIQTIGREPKITWKQIDEKYNFCKKTVVDVLHEQPDLKRAYLTNKEKHTHETSEVVDLATVDGTDKEITPAKQLISELKDIVPGRKDAKKYESLLLRIITMLFTPLLIDPRPQVTTVDGREIIDITFYNSASNGFWYDMKLRHNSLSIVIELKNMEDLANEEFFQISSRLNEKLGLFGILISRKNDKLDLQRAYRRYNNEKKVIINLTDDDIVQMLTDYENGLVATKHIYKKYREFVEEA